MLTSTWCSSSCSTLSLPYLVLPFLNVRLDLSPLVTYSRHCPQPSATRLAPARICITKFEILVRKDSTSLSDERHLGLNEANRLNWLHRKLEGPDRATARTSAALDPSVWRWEWKIQKDGWYGEYEKVGGRSECDGGFFISSMLCIILGSIQYFSWNKDSDSKDKKSKAPLRWRVGKI